MLAPGQCSDGSGNWLPLIYPDGSFETVCPSDPRYAELEALHAAGLNTTAKPEASRALGQSESQGNTAALFLGFGAIFFLMGLAYYMGGRAGA